MAESQNREGRRAIRVTPDVAPVFGRDDRGGSRQEETP